ncbi:MAG: hypothetical protein P3A28_07420 [Gemmatimonadota bacterium]|nr:hypothetical protein [Gemmatimonadota bacterium]
MLARVSVCAFLSVFAATAVAQQATSPTLGRDEIAVLARAELAIAKVRDSVNALLALPRNKTREAQPELQKHLLAQRAEVLKQNGLTAEEYRRRSFIVNTEDSARKIFDSVMVAMTGAALPGVAIVAANAGRGGAAANAPVMTPLIPGLAGVHIGHVANGWGDAPMGAGLLPTAISEARIAATHASLAARQPTNLDYMKTHAGHVVHAVDPTVAPSGPGLGYGVKKAATLMVTHIELAAAATGASTNIVTHAKHIATAARNTISRADQISALAQRVQRATTAAEAAPLVAQMATLAGQLMAGADANGDGRITWDAGEGGLQQADDHLQLMVKGETN